MTPLPEDRLAKFKGLQTIEERIVLIEEYENEINAKLDDEYKALLFELEFIKPAIKMGGGHKKLRFTTITSLKREHKFPPPDEIWPDQ